LTDSTSTPIDTQWQVATSPPAGLPDTLEALAYYDIQATKPYTPGNVHIRLGYDPTTITPVQAQFLQMWVYNTTTSRWINITTGLDTTGNVLYGVSPHLSMFAITSLQSIPQNLTVTGASCSETVVGPGCTYSIQAPIQNWGPQTPSFKVVIYANSTAEYTSQSMSLPPMGQTTINFVLNTTAMRSGKYAISVWNQLIKWITVTVRGQAGITGYKLMFKETVDNPFTTPGAIDYYWTYSVQKWSGVQWVATSIIGTSTLVTGYSIPALTTMDLPYSVCVLPMSGPNAVNSGDWLKISFTFSWTYSGTGYSVSYSTKLNVHPADTSGATVAPPYFGADGKVSTGDLTLLARYWGRTVAWTGTFDPTDELHRADTGKYGKVSTGDLTTLAKYWGTKGTWNNNPPPG
jgi:hypothetical protein